MECFLIVPAVVCADNPAAAAAVAAAPTLRVSFKGRLEVMECFLIVPAVVCADNPAAATAAVAAAPTLR
jgi:hypothetical protein